VIHGEGKRVSDATRAIDELIAMKRRGTRGEQKYQMSNSQTLRFLKLHSDATLPTRGSAQSAGLDLYAIEDLELQPGGRTAVRTGLAVAIPAGYYGRVAPRSGLAVKNGLDVLAGVIDSDYRGEIRCAIINLSAEAFQITAGMRIAQLIVESIVTPDPVWDTELESTTRGAGGFGSTG
jgi:dUTP pyrophosphatase